MKTTLIYLFLFTTFIIAAQSNFGITGIIVNEKQEPIELALITVLKAEDSTIVKGEYSEINGKFEINGLKTGVYILKVNLIGYNNYISNPWELNEKNTKKVFDNLILQTNAKVLEAVTITAKTPFVERKIDRTIINVDVLISNSSSNILEALEKSPGVSLDQNSNLKLRGKSGVVVFIDDKPTYLAGSELENYLKSIPASTVRQIEIMTNPPAKYEAAGNAGVINIITKRDKIAGWNGNVVSTLTQGRYTRNSNSFNLALNKKKWSIYFLSNVSVRNSFQDLNINRYYKNNDLTSKSNFEQNSFIEKTDQTFNGKIGFDYYANKSTTIGFSTKAFSLPSTDFTINTALVSNPDKTLINRVNADNKQENKLSNGTFNVYLKHNIDTIGSNISFDVDYVTYSSNSDQNFKNFIYLPNGTLTYQDLIQGNLPSTINIYAAKVDYAKPINSTFKFEAGLKTAFTKTDNEAAYKNTINNITTINYDLSNRFLYDEKIQAAYVNFTKKIGNIDLQAGLRAEYTTLKGNQLGNLQKPATAFEREYTSIFPTFYISWNVDTLSNHVFNFNYGRRIDRPYFEDLNPFISPLDKFTFYSGNPNLLPTFSNNYSLSHSYKGTLNTTFNYSKTIDGINETLEIDNNGIYYSRPGNIASNETFNLSLEASVPIQKWYTQNAYLEIGHQEYTSKLYTEQLNSKGNYMYISSTNSFILGKDWNAEIRGEYQSDVVSAQLLIKSYGTLNFAISKKILHELGSVKLALNDVLYTRRADGTINNLRLTDANWDSRLDSRSAAITFSYRFGKSSNKPKHNTSGSDSEQQRVKG
jgi:hypothetical protein